MFKEQCYDNARVSSHGPLARSRSSLALERKLRAKERETLIWMILLLPKHKCTYIHTREQAANDREMHRRRIQRLKNKRTIAAACSPC